MTTEPSQPLINPAEQATAVSSRDILCVYPQRVHSPGPEYSYQGLPATTSIMEGGRSAVSPDQKRRLREPRHRKRQAPLSNGKHLLNATEASLTLSATSGPVPHIVLPPRQGTPFIDAVKESQQNFRSDSKLKRYEEPC